MDAIEKMYDNIMKEMDEYNEANKAAAQLSTEEMIKAIYDVIVGGADEDEADEAASEDAGSEEVETETEETVKEDNE